MFLTAVATDTTQAQQIANGAVHVTNQVAGRLAAVNWAAPTWDMFIVLFFVVTVFLYGVSLGRDRIIVILVSIYMALAVVTNAPYIGALRGGGDQYAAFRVGLFVSISIALFFVLSRSALLRGLGALAGGGLFQVLFFSILHVGLIISITLSLLPADAVSHLAPLTRTLFASDVSRFAWIVSPIIAMTMLKGGEG